MLFTYQIPYTFMQGHTISHKHLHQYCIIVHIIQAYNDVNNGVTIFQSVADAIIICITSNANFIHLLLHLFAIICSSYFSPLSRRFFFYITIWVVSSSIYIFNVHKYLHKCTSYDLFHSVVLHVMKFSFLLPFIVVQCKM